MHCIHRFIIWLLILSFLHSIGGCSKPPERVYSLAINPWPGYELLYLAGMQGYFKEAGLNIKLEELSSLSDSMRAFVTGRVDGFSSTMVEAMLVKLQTQKRIKIVMVADYSDGGDIIVARKETASIKDLKGKRVGCELMGLGLVVLERALDLHGMGVRDVEVVNLEQLKGVDAMEQNQVDAFVTYPPESLKLLAKKDTYHSIFSSSETPKEILDVVSINEAILKEEPDFVPKFYKAWQMAIEFTRQEPELAYALMAERERISAEEFKVIFEQEIKILDAKESMSLMTDKKFMEKSLLRVCSSLKTVGQYGGECNFLHELVYSGNF